MEEREYDFSRASLGNLRMRLGLGRHLIRKVRSEWRYEEEWADTWPGVLRHLEDVTRAIVEELRRRRKEARKAMGVEKPPAQVVLAKPAILGAKSIRR